MKFRFNGQEQKLSFGAWPDVSLKEARRKCDEARMAVRDGRNPAREKKTSKLAVKAQLGQTFGAIAREVLNKCEADGSAKATLSKKEWLIRILDPMIGGAPIAEISGQEMFSALDAIQRSGRRETARRARSVAGEVFEYAIATGRASTNPVLLMRRALRVPQVKHMPAITDLGQLKGLLKAIDGATGYPSTLAALRITPHLFQRPGEIRKMKWENVDLEAARWSPPISDMKKRRPHDVPLSRQAVTIIREMERLRNGPFVFPAFHSPVKPISENTVNNALRRLGYSGVMTAHGFRSTASSLLNESGKWNPDAIERAMSRQVGTTVSSIYNRSSYWDERVQMMQWWSDFLDDLKQQPS